MILNYFVPAVRAFKQQKRHFLLNLIGLSIGLASAMLVALFVKHELSFDAHQPNAEQIYRVSQDYSKLGLFVIPIFNFVSAQEALEYSQVEDLFGLTMVSETGKAEEDVMREGVGFKLRDLYGATANIEKFIRMEVLAGNLKEAMSEPNGLALSQSEAERIFGSIDVVGETLSHQKGQYTIKAVFKDLPKNSHFGFKNLVYVEHDPSQRYSNSSYVYFRLASNTDTQALANTLSERYFNGPMAGQISIGLEPLLDLHLDAHSPFEMKAGGTRQVVMICAGLSLLLVLIASFNFINMTIAQSAKRAKEVGVRKALGASQSQLVTQFLSESVLVALIAFMCACVLVEIALPSFNHLVDRSLLLEYMSGFGISMVCVAILVGVLSGLYPAFYLSSFSAKRVLSGDLQRGSGAILIRKCLLTFQASLSVGLIIASMMLTKQLTHLQSLPLGYKIADQLVISELPVGSVFTKTPTALVERLSAIQGVKKLSIVDTQLTVSINNTLSPTWPNGEASGGITPVIGTGFNIVEGLGLELIAGRDFIPTYSTDWANRENGVTRVGTIITRTVANQAGFTNVAGIIGKTIKDPGRGVDMHVVGVVEDVKVGKVRSVNSNIMFLCGFNFLSPTSDVILSIDPTQAIHIKQQVHEVLAKQANIFEPQVNLLAENYQAALQDNQRVSDVVSLFTGLAVFLTCLGMLGLASFIAVRRQKEIAVRKVLGASRISLVNMLSKEFLVLVGLGAVLAFPVTYLLLEQWLNHFNDRIVQAHWIYLVAAFSVGLMTWLTVAVLSFQSASSRPSSILRCE